MATGSVGPPPPKHRGPRGRLIYRAGTNQYYIRTSRTWLVATAAGVLAFLAVGLICQQLIGGNSAGMFGIIAGCLVAGWMVVASSARDWLIASGLVVAAAV